PVPEADLMLERIGPWRLTGLAAPLAIWAAHFLAVYSMQGLACGEGWQRQRVAGLEMVSWWLLLATLLALAAIAWMGARALHGRRVAQQEMRGSRPDRAAAGTALVPAPPRAGGEAGEPAARISARRRRFTATVTALVALLAFVSVVFTTLPVLLLPPCA